MTAAPPAGTAAPVEPQGPTERLSLVRLSIVVLIVAAVIGVAFTGVRKAVADAQPRAKSWSVPYVDVTLTPTYQFQDPQSNPSRDVALAFVVADPGEPCRPSWGGAYTLDQAGDDLDLDRRIEQLRAAGGDAMISFGGLTNRELALACTDQAALTDAYRAVIDRYDASVIDLDLEGAALSRHRLDRAPGRRHRHRPAGEAGRRARRSTSGSPSRSPPAGSPPTASRSSAPTSRPASSCSG